MQDNLECSRYTDFPQPFPSIEPGDGSRLSRDDINALPLFHYCGKTHLVHSPADMEYALSRLSRKGAASNGKLAANTAFKPVLGFDTETRPSFRKGTSHSPSLLQLALEDEVFLFHFKWLPFDQRLISLLEDPNIIKTGVAVHDDMAFLAKITPFTPASVVDLGEVARKNGVENRGLRGLSALFLGLRISKGEQCSNWGNSELSPRQIRYAATDAWISRALYFRMRESGLDFTPEAKLPERKRGRCRPKLTLVKKQPRSSLNLSR